MPFVPTESDNPKYLYRCPEPGCGRRFSRKYTMIEHTKSHTGEKPHLCPVRACGKRFSMSGNLSRHKRLHETIDPLPCPAPGCRSTFESANKLEKHMKFHRGDAVHVCAINYCGKTFSTTSNLNRHVKNHHGGLHASVATSKSDQDADMKQKGASHESFAEVLALAGRATVEDGGVRAGASSVEHTDAYAAVNSMESRRATVDALTEIFHDRFAVPGNADDDIATDRVSSIFDDVISFHVTHL